MGGRSPKGKQQKEVIFPERIPRELADFLRRATYSLLIKGSSGTGKTILALSILRALKVTKGFLYVSTRTSPVELLQSYTWIGETFDLGPLLESSSSGGAGEGSETLVDARLDEPNAIFERITNELMDRQAPTIVIDSWEALSDSVEAEALRVNARVLETWRERAGARFIFTGEDPRSTALDSLMDGVLMLRQRSFLGRRVREVLLSKLRGVEIRRPTYFFSLDGGIFRSFDRFRSVDYSFSSGAAPIELMPPRGSAGRRFSTGYPNLDREMEGGFSKGSLVTLELDPRVDMKVALVFLSALIATWAASGNPIVVQEMRGIEEGYFDHFAKTFLRGSKPGQVVTWGSGESEKEETEGGLPQKGWMLLEKLRGSLDVARKGRPKGSILNIMSWGGASTYYEGEPETLQRVTALAKSEADLSILVTKPTSPRHSVAGVTATQIRISNMSGTLFLHSEVPWSGFFGISAQKSSGVPTLRLESMV